MASSGAESRHITRSDLGTTSTSTKLTQRPSKTQLPVKRREGIGNTLNLHPVRTRLTSTSDMNLSCASASSLFLSAPSQKPTGSFEGPPDPNWGPCASISCECNCRMRNCRRWSVIILRRGGNAPRGTSHERSRGVGSIKKQGGNAGTVPGEHFHWISTHGREDTGE